MRVLIALAVAGGIECADAPPGPVVDSRSVLVNNAGPAPAATNRAAAGVPSRTTDCTEDDYHAIAVMDLVVILASLPQYSDLRAFLNRASTLGPGVTSECIASIVAAKRGAGAHLQRSLPAGSPTVFVSRLSGMRIAALAASREMAGVCSSPEGRAALLDPNMGEYAACITGGPQSATRALRCMSEQVPPACGRCLTGWANARVCDTLELDDIRHVSCDEYNVFLGTAGCLIDLAPPAEEAARAAIPVHSPIRPVVPPVVRAAAAASPAHVCTVEEFRAIATLDAMALMERIRYSSSAWLSDIPVRLNAVRGNRFDTRCLATVLARVETHQVASCGAIESTARWVKCAHAAVRTLAAASLPHGASGACTSAALTGVNLDNVGELLSTHRAGYSALPTFAEHLPRGDCRQCLAGWRGSECDRVERDQIAACAAFGDIIGSIHCLVDDDPIRVPAGGDGRSGEISPHSASGASGSVPPKPALNTPTGDAAPSGQKAATKYSNRASLPVLGSFVVLATLILL